MSPAGSHPHLDGNWPTLSTDYSWGHRRLMEFAGLPSARGMLRSVLSRSRLRPPTGVSQSGGVKSPPSPLPLPGNILTVKAMREPQSLSWWSKTLSAACDRGRESPILNTLLISSKSRTLYNTIQTAFITEHSKPMDFIIYLSVLRISISSIEILHSLRVPLSPCPSMGVLTLDEAVRLLQLSAYYYRNRYDSTQQVKREGLAFGTLRSHGSRSS